MESNIVCRTCLADEGELFEIFGETGVELSLPQKLQDHVKIMLDDQDIYTLMCGKCIQILNEFHDMYSLAQEIQPQFSNAIEVKADYNVVKSESELVFEEYENTDGVVVTEEPVIQDESQLEEVIIEENIEDHDPVITIFNPYEGLDGSDIISEVDEDDEDDIITDEEEEELPTDEETETRPKRERRRQTKKQIRDIVSAEERAQEDADIKSIVPLNCTDCEFFGDTMEDLINHYRQIHRRFGSIQCCGREFTRRVKLVEHVKLHINPNAFTCHICQKTFTSKYTLNNHIPSHVPEELCEFVCDQCPKKFSTQNRLATHQRIHRAESVECPICKKIFGQKSTLYSHIKGVHQRPSDALICEVCAKPFKTREAFMTHQVTHLEVQPPRISCHICSKKLKNRETLNQHLLRHKRENDQVFCDICNKVFNCKKRMNQHKKFVHNPEPLKCDHCEKTFKRPIYLKEHMASHTGESLYTCSYCPRQFNSNANKYSHQKAQHPEEWKLAKQKRLEE